VKNGVDRIQYFNNLWLSNFQMKRVTASDGLLLKGLDDRVRFVVKRARNSDLWKMLLDRKTKPKQTEALLRELYLEAYSYFHHVFEAAALIVSRFPKSSPPIVPRLLKHLADEADHGELSLQAHVGLGGDENRARSARMSAGAFAVASFWRGLAAMENPFCYLGAMYLFETTTPQFSVDILKVMQRHQMRHGADAHAAEHVKVDAAHAKLFRDLIQAAMTDPRQAESIRFGFEAFAAFYPEAIFSEAFRRATRSNS
jgi:pyrroloquinoline quinone (PQQ) biosynthesis protein C